MAAVRNHLPRYPKSRYRKQSTKSPNRSSRIYQSKVTPLPKRSRQLPLALQFLLLVQKSCTTLTFVLVAITLTVYGWTVYAPTLWSQEFSKLKTLQRNERQLISTNETLKHKMAKQAEQPGSGLTQPNPSQSLFLPPADSSDLTTPVTPSSNPEEPLVVESPVSY